MSPRRGSWLGLALAALLTAPGAAEAAVSVTATLPALPAPFSNAVTAWGTASSLTVTVTNQGDQPAFRIDFQMPNNGYTASGGTPPGATWVASLTSSGGIGVVRFEAACATGGLAPGATATFVINLVTPQGATPADTVTSAFRVTGSTLTCSAPESSGQATFTAAVKALSVSGTVAADGLGLSGSVTWTVNNLSSAAQSSVTLTTAVSPAGATQTCPTISSIPAHDSRNVTCTYTVPAAGTYRFAANASNGAGTATAVGAWASGSLEPTAPRWTRAVAVRGRPATHTLSFTLTNTTSTRITRLDVTYPYSAGWILSTPSATGLSYSSRSSTPGNAVFTGRLNAGGVATVTLPFSAVPTVSSTTTYGFAVRMTPSTGSAVTVNQQVALVVPLPEVAGLTIQASAAGQALAWTNTSGNGSLHDGVVIFRAPAGTDPALPADFATHAAGSGGVVFADGAAGTTAAFADTAVGSYNYRVCNRDTYGVFSACDNGYWNGEGWLDSQAYPAGGWVHAVGGSALLRPGFFPGSRFGLANNGPALTVLDTSTGARAFAPVALPSLPSTNTPAVRLSDDRWVTYAADQAGVITAVDLETGELVWQVTKAGANFTAGVSGIVRWAASAEFAAAYPMDILLIGSTSGTVYAVDTLTGATLWSFPAGAGIFALITYDPLTDLFYVPTAGAGVRAYSLAGSSPSIPPSPAPGWSFPEPAGTYRLTCVRTALSAGLACVNVAGLLHVVDKLTGALQVPAYATAIPGPTSLARVDGVASAPGLVVSSATQLQVLTTAGTPYAVASAGVWSPGLTLSPPAVYANSGYLVVGASDRRLHRIDLASATQLAESPQVGSQGPILRLGQPAYDAASGRYLFGTSDGHIWALPSF